MGRPRRPARWFRSALAALVVLAPAAAIVTTTAAAAPPASAAATSIGVHADQAGTSWFQDQTGLTPQVVAGGTFGELYNAKLQGQIQAEPLVANGTLLVVTEANHAYGLDPATGAARWDKSYGTPFDSSKLGCLDLPMVGITGTPVVDTATNTEYFLSKTYFTGTSGAAKYLMHAVDVGTGTERPGFPVLIAGHASNDPVQSFDATYQLQRPGLVLMDGVVYAAFGGHCDIPPTHGWVIGVRTNGQIATMWSDEAGVRDGTGRAGIWAPGALRVIGPGKLLAVSGNGTVAPGPTPGAQVPDTLGQAVMTLDVQPDGSLRATDFFTPFDSPYLNNIDGDLGSGAPVVLPPQWFSTPTHRQLVAEIGKEGYLYILDANDLGGYQQGPNNGDKVLARLGPVQGVWGTPAVWGGDGGYLYIVTNGGSDTGQAGETNGKLLAWKFGVDGAGNPTFALTGQSADSFAYGGSSPAISSSGSTSGTSVLWVNWVDNETTDHAQLRAYDPVPQADGTLRLLWSGPSGAASKLASLGIFANRVYTTTRDGVVHAFGAPVQSPLSGGALQFPDTVVGASTTIQDTFTATRPLTVTSVAVAGTAYSLGAPSAPLPLTLAAGQSFSVATTFKPARFGILGGTITVQTSAGAYAVSLTGNGLSASARLTVAPFALSFEGTAVGSAVTASVVFTNQGSAPLAFTGADKPPAPFSVAGLPATGATLAPGQSVAVAATFAPTATGQSTGALTLHSNSGGDADLALSGTAGVPAKLKVTPNPTLDFGTVPLGASVTKTFTVANAGGSPMTISRSKPPAGGIFTATSTLSEGTVLQPGQTVTETVVFRPKGAGAAADSWSINGSGASMIVNLNLVGTGTTALPPPPSAGGWSLLGTAQMSGADLVLTPTSTWVAGSAVSPTAIATDGLSVSFDAAMVDGGGADGMTLTFADPASPTFLGSSGGSLGYSTIKGVAVGLDDFKNTSDPVANFVGIADTGPVAEGIPHWVATSAALSDWHGTTKHVVVSVKGTQLTVSVAGAQVLQKSVPSLPPTARIVFTAGNGGVGDRHIVRNVSFAKAGPAPTAPPAGGWALAGTAQLAGADLVLTPTTNWVAGSAASPGAVATDGVTVAFDAAMVNGSGADGMTLTFADPASPTFLGYNGGCLGFCGITGVAVGLDQFKNPSDPVANFVGLADAGPVAEGIPHWVATSAALPAWHGAVTHVVVTVKGTLVTVAVGGKQVLQKSVPTLPPVARLVFTGGNGGANDQHIIRNVTFS